MFVNNSILSWSFIVFRFEKSRSLPCPIERHAGTCVALYIFKIIRVPYMHRVQLARHEKKDVVLCLSYTLLYFGV